MECVRLPFRSPPLLADHAAAVCFVKSKITSSVARKALIFDASMNCTSSAASAALAACPSGDPSAAFIASPLSHQTSVSPSGGLFQPRPAANASLRSEENTSELQSLMRISYAVFCLKKKQHKHKH